MDQRQDTRPRTEPGSDRLDTPTPVELIDFRDEGDAQAAVGRLSDLGFPVSSVPVVWRGLRRVEQVGRAAQLLDLHTHRAQDPASIEDAGSGAAPGRRTDG